MAILIKDITVVFDFAGTIGCSFITYFFPAIGYLIALNRFGTQEIRKKWETKAFQGVSWLFIVIGTTAVASYFFSLVLKITGKMPQETQ